MNEMICRLLHFAVSDGPCNMAADEALLESAVAGRTSLRLYGWASATVSLGYFQPAALRDADPPLAALPFVRRPTGGATLVHHHELTYALALPAGPEWQPRGKPWLCRMHGVLAAALASLGVTTHACCAGEEKKLGEVLCFLHQTPGDLLCRGAKVVGSAQRKRHGALLQHGAVLLAQSPHAPALPGLRELAGFGPERVEALKSATLDAFARETGWRLEPADWTADERTNTAKFGEKYYDTSWNRKR